MDRIRCGDFGECRVDSLGKHVFALQPHTGATLLTNKTLMREISQQEIPPALSQELIRCGFAPVGEELGMAFARRREIMPLFFMADLTRMCSNRCTYCFRNLQSPAHMSEEILRRIVARIVSYCRRCNRSQITFQAWGGEPLLVWDRICLIQDLFNEAGIEVRMLVETNGVSVTPRIAREMVLRGILCSVSIDGPAHVHDRHRHLAGGGGSHAMAVRGLELLRDSGYGNKVGAVCVVTSSSLPYVGELVGYFCNELGLPRVKMNLVKDSRELADKTLCLQADQVSRFWNTLLDELVSVNECGTSFGESTIVAMLHNLTTHRPVSFCHSQGCQAGYKMISFDQEGKFYPCDMVDDGTMCMESSESVDDFVSTLADQTERHPFFTTPLPEECRNCDWRAFCGGGCRATRIRGGSGRASAECLRNTALYPRLIDLILDKPHVISLLTRDEITIA